MAAKTVKLGGRWKVDHYGDHTRVYDEEAPAVGQMSPGWKVPWYWHLSANGERIAKGDGTDWRACRAACDAAAADCLRAGEEGGE